MVIEVVRIGQRLVRDDRVTTHVALVSRGFGAEKIYMTEINPEIKDTIEKIGHQMADLAGEMQVQSQSLSEFQSLLQDIAQMARSHKVLGEENYFGDIAGERVVFSISRSF